MLNGPSLAWWAVRAADSRSRRGKTHHQRSQCGKPHANDHNPGHWTQRVFLALATLFVFLAATTGTGIVTSYFATAHRVTSSIRLPGTAASTPNLAQGRERPTGASPLPENTSQKEPVYFTGMESPSHHDHPPATMVNDAQRPYSRWFLPRLRRKGAYPQQPLGIEQFSRPEPVL